MSIEIKKLFSCLSIFLKTSTIPSQDWFSLAKSIIFTLIKNPNSIFNRNSSESKNHFLTDYIDHEIVVKSPKGFKFIARPKFEDFVRFLFSEELAKWEPISEIKPKEDQIIVDVGANVGYYTIVLAQKVGKNGKVIAIEPDPETFNILKKNCELNNLANVELHNVAISDQEGSLKFFKSETHSGKSSLVPNSSSQTITVNSITLDNLLGKNFSQIHWLKIDVEGFEFFVLKGSASILPITQNILIEVHEEIMRKQNQKPEELIKILTDSGFKVTTFNEYWDEKNSQNQTLKSDYILGERID